MPAGDCFRSCAFDPEFNYISTSALYAQVLCEFYGSSCNQPDKFTPPAWLDWFIDPDTFKRDLLFKSRAQRLYHEQTPVDEDPLLAQRFCMFYGVVVFLPYLALFSVALYIIFNIPSLLLSIAVFSTQLILQILFYTHMSTE